MELDSEETMCGSLRLIFGPMFAGKSSLTNAELIKQNELGARVLKIVHAADRQRTGTVRNVVEQGTTHNAGFGLLPESITVISALELRSLDVAPFQFIGVDEGQFFTDILEVVPYWVDRLGKHVIVSALDGDTNRNPFGDGQVLRLIPHANKITKLNAHCKFCIEEQRRFSNHCDINNFQAPFTVRLVSNSDQVYIGGSESFAAACRYHHRQLQRK